MVDVGLRELPLAPRRWQEIRCSLTGVCQTLPGSPRAATMTETARRELNQLNMSTQLIQENTSATRYSRQFAWTVAFTNVQLEKRSSDVIPAAVESHRIQVSPVHASSYHTSDVTAARRYMSTTTVVTMARIERMPAAMPRAKEE